MSEQSEHLLLPFTAMSFDRYGSDVLASGGSPHHRTRPTAAELPVSPGLVVEDVTTGWVGAAIRVEKSGGVHLVELEDRHGRTRSFPLGPGFLVDGKPVILTRPTRTAAAADPGGAQAAARGAQPGTRSTARSASGSVYVHGARARVARGSRIWVEGKHDAELVQKVWGHDLRIEGVVVEMLDGVDNLVERVQEFGPSTDQKLGILVDHLVPGTKEWRLAEQVMRLPEAKDTVLILGHPYVDVWQAVKPERVGLEAWPHVPKGTDIKVGSLAALGWPRSSQADIAEGWQRILGQVRSYADVEPTLSGRIEELIDWVTT